jgi:hypothetical protein
MNKYRFALLRYLMGAINSVSPSAIIKNNSLHYDVNKTDRNVYGLNNKALATKLAEDGWECTRSGGHLEAKAIRKDFDCHLSIRINDRFCEISTWAYRRK